MTKKRFSISKRLKSFKYAFRGIYFFIRKEHNAWIHIAATIIVIGLGIFYKLNPTEWALIVFAIAIVLASEAINTSVERVVNMISPERNKKAGKIKDIAAGAVLICAIAAAAVGLLVFLPKVFYLAHH